MAESSKAHSQAHEIAKILGQLFEPLKIYHYGSRTQGKETSASDYDFVVVVAQTNRSRWDNHELAKRAVIEKLGLLADVWVYTESDFNEWKDDFSSIPEKALNTGLEISLG